MIDPSERTAGIHSEIIKIFLFFIFQLKYWHDYTKKHVKINTKSSFMNRLFFLLFFPLFFHDKIPRSTSKTVEICNYPVVWIRPIRTRASCHFILGLIKDIFRHSIHYSIILDGCVLDLPRFAGLVCRCERLLFCIHNIDIHWSSRLFSCEFAAGVSIHVINLQTYRLPVYIIFAIYGIKMSTSY